MGWKINFYIVSKLSADKFIMYQGGVLYSSYLQHFTSIPLFHIHLLVFFLVGAQ